MLHKKIAPTKKSRILTFIVTVLLLSMALASTAAADDLIDDYETTYDPEAYEIFEENREFVTTVNLRLRSGPSLDHGIIVVLPTGTHVEALSFNPYSEFNPVTLGDLNGYVATRYLAPVGLNQSQNAVVRAASHNTPNGTVELLPWSYVRNILPIGTLIEVYDIWTGLTYTVRNFSNGNHADVETWTQEDTNTMRASSGGRFSWDARPVLVSFNGRTVAAAINTMPHAGWTIQNNGLNGHVCLHFYQSRTHNGNRSYEREMQNAVMQAFNHNR
ncbi:MAG: SH3 domain-containing protein [Clostridiales bacterium]|jgi:hypothetical protein|nr:SH3 domain-containing protein [Clostridiales bacterium]